jgi:3-hydroxyisobutyrate dehydrogenase-like beta-hydroxyacid dehydrogenase
VVKLANNLGFKTGLALKDLVLFDQLAVERNLRMPMADGAIEWYRRGRDSGFSDAGQCAIATVDAEKRADNAA